MSIDNLDTPLFHMTVNHHNISSFGVTERNARSAFSNIVMTFFVVVSRSIAGTAVPNEYCGAPDLTLAIFLP